MDEQIGYRTINARAETLVEKPSFLRPFQTQRCLVIADGFYEWSNVANLVSPKASAVAQGSADGARKEAKKKTPLAVRLKNNKPFGFAGLYDMWHSPEDDIITSCTIITTEPNELIATIHNRMPAILSPDIYDIWLDKNLDDTRRLMSLLIPYDSNKMEAYEVSALVNSVENNSPKLIEPVGKSTLF
jgi:putative SOS response-associated peptidase YedK